MITFWQWFRSGAGNTKAGWRLLFNRWLLLDLMLGFALYVLIPVSPYEFAAKALFPAASILVGMAVAWTSRASAVLQDQQFRKSVISKDRPLEAYVYGYQLALLVIILMVIFVTITANGGFTVPVPNVLARFATGIALYALLSLAVRECWGVINFSSLLSILHGNVPQNGKDQ